jgi:hypothetical protein
MPTRDVSSFFLSVTREILLLMHLVRNHKLLGSGGSMVARLKLKGIDGGAPPGVERAA